MKLLYARVLGNERLKYLRYRGQTIFFAPIAAGLLTAMLLAFSAQLREIYLAIAEGPDWSRGVLGIGMLALLSALIFVSSFMLSTWRADSLYPNHADIRFDRRLLAQRDWLALAVAMLPLAGLFIGVSTSYRNATGLNRGYRAALDDLGTASALPPGIPDKPGIDDLQAGYTCIIVAAFAIVLLFALHASRSSRRIRWGILAAAAIVSIVAAFVPFAATGPQVVAVTRFLGPPATIAAVIIALYSLLMLLSYLTRVSGIPFIGILAAVGITLGFLNISRNVSPTVQQTLAPLATSEQIERQERHEAKTADDLEGKFRLWLENRADRDLFREAGKPYPVFVFAAQGGGLYAASAIGRTFAQLQRDCPAFMQHVFAISAVSGGAVGSAVIHEVAAAQQQSLDCASSSRDDLIGRISQVTLEDHLSPIVGSIIPDIIRKLIPGGTPDNAVTRSKALEQSVLEAVYRDNGAAPACEAKGPLCAPFADHWNARSASPALVFNATWVENGHRVAFAPFGLEPVGDLTLHSFSDFEGILSTKEVTLIEAAIVSARFPGVLSAEGYGAKVGEDDNRWNFVDGGYADASGAATALQIFDALNRMLERDRQQQPPPDLQNNRLDVDLRLVLVTDSESDPNLAEIDGTGFSDTMAPISALLNIRALLSSRAVAQAVSRGSELDKKSQAAGQATTDDRRVMVIELDRKTFQLSIGWKISRATYNIVGLLLGDPSLCRSTRERREFDSRAARSIAANSCITQNILRLLRRE